MLKGWDSAALAISMGVVAEHPVPALLPGGSCPLPVLLVEDDENDVFFTQLAWNEASVFNPLWVCDDGDEAIKYLSGINEFADRENYPLPCALLTDLHTPNVDGFRLLEWMQVRPQFIDMPKFAFSANDDQNARNRVLALGATDYLIKPMSMPERTALVRNLARNWFPHAAPSHSAKASAIEHFSIK